MNTNLADIALRIGKWSFVMILAFVTFHGLVNATHGIDNSRIMMRFGYDETRIVENTRSALQRGTLRPPSYNYGYLYETVSYGVLRLLAAVQTLTQTRTVAYVMRSVSCYPWQFPSCSSPRQPAG